jgi:hypothetical protein
MMILRRYIGISISGLLLAAVACAQNGPPSASSSETPPARSSRPPADLTKYAVIISGASGETTYASQFGLWVASLHVALTDKLGFADARIKVLTEKPGGAVARATADDVRRTFQTLQSELKPESSLFIFLIGHGSFDGKEAKFNLVGPDLSASEYGQLLTALPTRRVVIINMASASGEFIKPLAAKGRIVLTATRSGQEQNATRYAEFFIKALNAKDVDSDQDGHLSVWEVFNYANRLTADFYTQAGRLATEHAVLDDEGDGIGHDKAEPNAGRLAKATYLDSLSSAQAAANAATLKLMAERTRLEGEIEQLIVRKRSFNETEYEAALEKLFIQLAKVNRAIRQAGS